MHASPRRLEARVLIRFLPLLDLDAGWLTYIQCEQIYGVYVGPRIDASKSLQRSQPYNPNEHVAYHCLPTYLPRYIIT
jgi:hypothetical protein